MELTAKSHPSHKCFEATLEVASENENAVVAHGWLYNGTQWILHAWCEVGDTVLDLTESREPLPKETYYAVMGVTEERTIRYARLDFFTIAAASGGFGPFDTKFFFAESSSEDPLQASGA